MKPSMWRWTCPHCGVGAMRLQSAEKHLQRKHYDCGSCKIERLMVQSMLEGRGFIVRSEDPFSSLFARGGGKTLPLAT